MKTKSYIIATFLGMCMAFTSCQDFMETDSDRQIFEPKLDQKTDSMFYTLGILKSVQQAIDQYVLVNEMRGDLTEVNKYTQTDLRRLADFSADATNKYDSAYLYYRIINNCNYYIAHRDTSLRTGSRQVAMQEYAQAYAIRAWTYLQLAKTYGTVPFYTHPVTSISQANEVMETKDLQGICDALIPDLLRLANQSSTLGTADTTYIGVPRYGDIVAGNFNNGGRKTVYSHRLMFPIDLVLGDLYLESGQYERAAKAYFNYIVNNRLTMSPIFASVSNIPNRRNNEMPNDFMSYSSSPSWTDIFARDPGDQPDIITLVPMAVNRLRGETTSLPQLFGYDLYSTEVLSDDTVSTFISSTMFLEEREIDASASFKAMAEAQDYYYQAASATADIGKSVLLGDMRYYATFISRQSETTRENFDVMRKFNYGNIPVYRGSTVYLRLAEALNRMGYPDAAFAILKDGINSTPTLIDTTYIRPATREMFTNIIPFYSERYRSYFTTNWGIHGHGCGYTRGKSSVYQMDTIVGKKLEELQRVYNIQPTGTLNDTINAVEDLLCDEYALEFAYEGNRFGDLCRIARHKNRANLYENNFGGRWLATKLAYKNPVVNLAEERNWFLPFK